MGTKNNPAPYDCLAKAHPDEPYFVLLGRDPVASILVTMWSATRKVLGETDEAQLAEARECSMAMHAWAIKHGKDPNKASKAFGLVLTTILESFKKAN